MNAEINENIEIVISKLSYKKFHKRAGIYHNATKKVLQLYRTVKYDSIETKRQIIIEKMKAKDYEIKEDNPFVETLDKMFLLDIHFKNRYEVIEDRLKETALIIFKIDLAMEIAFSSQEIELKKIIEEKYLKKENRYLTNKEIVEKSGQSMSTYYKNLNKAIEILSINLWGIFGEKSPYFKEQFN